MAYCIQLTKRFHKIQPPMANLEKRQALREMTRGLGRDNEFFTWANHYFIPKPATEALVDVAPSDQGWFNCLVVKEDAFNNFIEHYLTSTQKSKYKAAQFKKALIAYCEYYDFEFNPLHIQGIVSTEGMEADPMKRRILKTIAGVSKEYIYISTQRNKPVVDNAEELTPEETEDLPF
jgi:hypothetical protein